MTLRRKRFEPSGRTMRDLGIELEIVAARE
jgi:hypothetical protein